jgi:hypothetical protein
MKTAYAVEIALLDELIIQLQRIKQWNPPAKK